MTILGHDCNGRPLRAGDRVEIVGTNLEFAWLRGRQALVSGKADPLNALEAPSVEITFAEKAWVVDAWGEHLRRLDDRTDHQPSEFTFDRWFDQSMDPELNLTPGDKELCRHAWQAALSHAEGEAQPVAWGLKWSEDVGVNPQTVFRTEAHAQAYRAECQSADTIMIVPLYTHPAPQVAVPEGCVPVPRTLVERWANVDAFNAPKGAAMELKTIAQQMLSVPDDRDRAVAGEQANRCIGTINDLLDEREIAAPKEPLHGDGLVSQLLGRAKFLRDKGGVKTPGLLERAAQCLSENAPDIAARAILDAVDHAHAETAVNRGVGAISESLVLRYAWSLLSDEDVLDVGGRLRARLRAGKEGES